MLRSFGRNWFGYGQEGKTYKLGKGSVSGRQRNYMFRNDDGVFSNVAWILGTASVRDGRGTAIADYDRSLESDPRNALTAAIRAATLLEAGDLEGAIAGFESALQLADDPGLRARIQAALATLTRESGGG